MDRADAAALGFEEYVKYWGVGGARRVRGGEVTAGRFIMWKNDLTGFNSPYHMRKSVIIHESLHALIPIHHSTRPASIMGGSGLSLMSPRDAELIRLNSHPLVRPGMSMEDVRKVIVLADELLDYQQAESDGTPADPLDLVWWAYVALVEAGSAGFRLSGGWIDRACNQTFGVRRGPIDLSIGDFRVFKDDPALLYLDFHTSEFYIVYSRKDAEWTHWQPAQGGTWEKVERGTVVDTRDALNNRLQAGPS